MSDDANPFNLDLQWCKTNVSLPLEDNVRNRVAVLAPACNLNEGRRCIIYTAKSAANWCYTMNKPSDCTLAFEQVKACQGHNPTAEGWLVRAGETAVSSYLINIQ